MASSIMVVTLLACVLMTVFAYNPNNPWDFRATTPKIDTIVKGRCEEYKVVSSHDRDLYMHPSCDTVWNTLLRVFVRRDPFKYRYSEGRYSSLLSLLHNTQKLTDKAMFWSGTREIVHDFTRVNHDYYTLEDTFPGYVANNLNWCGCSKCADGIQHSKDCESSNKTWSAIIPYWDAASRKFAEKAAGTVYVLVNGTTQPGDTAYYSGSVFGRIELPTLGKLQQVSLLHVLVIFNVDEDPKEKCGEGSLEDLFAAAKENNITSLKCTDDPLMVNAILCAKYPHADQCKNKQVSSKWKVVGITMIVFTIVFLILFIIACICVYRRGSK